MNWPIAKIGDVCRVLPGFAFKSADFSSTGIPVVKIASIRDDLTVNIDRTQCIQENVLTERLRRFILADGDIVLAMTGATAGKIGRVKTKEALLLNQRVAKIEAIKAVPNYIWCVLSARKYREQFYKLAGGAAQPNISGGQIEQVEISLPPPDVQSQIAEIIFAYDELIANNTRRIALLERSAKLLFEEWFVRLRYPGHERGKITGGVPEGWRKTKLKDVADTNTESYSARNLPGEINYVDISSVKTGRITKTKLHSIDAPGRARRIARDGDVIWSNVRPNLRQYALVLAPDPHDIFSTGFTILSTKSVPFSFLYIATTTDAFVGRLVNFTTGSSYPAVRSEDFESADMLIPSEGLLRDFHDICEPMLRQCKNLSDQNVILAQARDHLLPRLMEGRISV